LNIGVHRTQLDGKTTSNRSTD